MLEVGVRGTLTPTENRAHLGMWAMTAAPPMAGNDVTAMPPDVRAVLTDPDVVALDKDPAGHGRRAGCATDGRTEVWARPLADGSLAVALLNRSDDGAVVSTTTIDAGAPAAAGYAMRDLWAKTTTTTAGPISAPGA